MTQTTPDLVIIGGGPAGLTAALYAGRARLDTVLLERAAPGGLVALRDLVETYPGFPDGVSGFELGELMRRQAEAFGARLISAEATALERDGADWLVRANGDTLRARTVIVATGERHQRLDVPGEVELLGRGVSSNAIRDGSFFREQPVAVVGGCDQAVAAADFLARFCRPVYLVVPGPDLDAEQVLRERIRANANIEVRWQATVERIVGTDHVESLELLEARAGQSTLEVAGVFVCIGWEPNAHLLAPHVELDADGYAVAGEDTATAAAGLFVAGDVRSKVLHQTVTAVADGATAAWQAAAYLRPEGKGDDG